MAFVKRAERFSATAAPELPMLPNPPTGLKPLATATKPACAGCDIYSRQQKTPAPDRDEGLLRGSTQLHSRF